jgi:glutamine synthetase
MAALLAAGTLGIRQKLPLVAKDCQPGDHLTSEATRNELGIKKRLPLNLQEARELLQRDTELVEELGQEFVSKFTSVNKVRRTEGVCDTG